MKRWWHIRFQPLFSDLNSNMINPFLLRQGKALSPSVSLITLLRNIIFAWFSLVGKSAHLDWTNKLSRRPRRILFRKWKDVYSACPRPIWWLSLVFEVLLTRRLCFGVNQQKCFLASMARWYPMDLRHTDIQCGAPWYVDGSRYYWWLYALPPVHLYMLSLT